MNSDDMENFQTLLKETSVMYNAKLTNTHLKMYFGALKEYSLNDIGEALARCVQRCKFMPKPVEIIELIPGGHPSPDEAWESLPKTEHDGGYVTDEIMSCAPFNLLDSGDLIAARKAFIETYQRKQKNGKPKFWYSGASIGSESQKRNAKEQAILIAVDKKWLTPERAKNLLTELSPKSEGSYPQLEEKLKAIKALYST